MTSNRVWPMAHPIQRLILAAVVLAVVLIQAPASSQSPAPAVDIPVLAYYYIWFTPDSWDRAKTDLPLLGPYASDDPATMRQHVQWAKTIGIDGFLVSWKHTEPLSHRLAQLVEIAAEEDFKLSIIYESLDFWRHPLPVDRIEQDFAYFSETYGSNPVFDMFGNPVVMWSGTWQFDRTEIARVTEPHRDRLQILASEKQPEHYTRVADLFDGNSYYWSSVNPATFPDYSGKLQRMRDAVDEYGGLWIAPAAPGFDAQHLGGDREVPRHDGATLETELATALESAPDAIGLISWNEFSENSHIEPSCEYGDDYLAITARLLGGSQVSVDHTCDEVALATAEAGAVVASPIAGTATNQPSPGVGAALDWDSSTPGGTVDRGARLGILLLIGSLFGLMAISIVQIARRAIRLEGSGQEPPDSNSFGRAGG